MKLFFVIFLLTVISIKSPNTMAQETENPIMLTVTDVKIEDGNFLIKFLSDDHLVTTISDSTGAALLALINQALIQPNALRLRRNPHLIGSILEQKVAGWNSDIAGKIRNLLLRLTLSATKEDIVTTTRNRNSGLSATQINEQARLKMQELQNRATNPLLSFSTPTYRQLNCLIGHFFYHWGFAYGFESMIELEGDNAFHMEGGELESLEFQSTRQYSYGQAGLLLNNFNNVICIKCLSDDAPKYLLKNPSAVLRVISTLEIPLF